jgi:hypothetical protein
MMMQRTGISSESPIEANENRKTVWKTFLCWSTLLFGAGPFGGYCRPGLRQRCRSFLFRGFLLVTIVLCLCGGPTIALRFWQGCKSLELGILESIYLLFETNKNNASEWVTATMTH